MSTPNDTRSPITDALETLGMIHFKKEKRDAIHLAVLPAMASQRLKPGERIGIVGLARQRTTGEETERCFDQ